MNSTSTSADILVLNQMAGPLTWELVEDLASAGYRVELLTGHPDTLAKGSPPRLRLHPAHPYQRGGLPRRVYCWLRYLVQAFFWLWRYPPQTPLLVFSNPPLLPGLAATMHALRGTRYCIMVHDIYPDVLVRMGHLRGDSWLVRCWQCMNRWAYARAEQVLTLGDHMAETLAGTGSPDQRSLPIAVVRPWADTDRIRRLPKSDNPFAQQYGLTDKLTVMYSGNMGWGHDIETMLAAAQQLGGADVHFMFIGAGPKWAIVEQHINAHQPQGIRLLGWLPENELVHSLPAADIALISVEPELGGLAIPSKAFYSLSAGVPLLVIANENTELADLVHEHKCGWRVAPGDDEQLAAIISHLAAAPAELQRYQANARRTAELIGSRRENSQRLIDILAQRLFAGDWSPSAVPADGQPVQLSGGSAG